MLKEDKLTLLLTSVDYKRFVSLIYVLGYIIVDEGREGGVFLDGKDVVVFVKVYLDILPDSEGVWNES